jgi:hypothetical protein
MTLVYSIAPLRIRPRRFNLVGGCLKEHDRLSTFVLIYTPPYVYNNTPKKINRQPYKEFHHPKRKWKIGSRVSPESILLEIESYLQENGLRKSKITYAKSFFSGGVRHEDHQ